MTTRPEPFPGLHWLQATAATLVLAAACVPRPAPESPWPGIGGADSVRVTPLAPGVRHVYLWMPAGPWAVHVVEVDDRVCAPVIAARKAGPPLEERALTSRLGAGAMAAVNADFFMIPAGTPIGAHVTGRRVLVGPGARPVYAVTGDLRHWAGTAALAGVAAATGDSAALAQVNRPLQGGRHHPPAPGLTLLDRWYGDRAPADSTGRTLRLRRLGPTGSAGGSTAGGDLGEGGGRAGPDGDAVVVSVHAPGEPPALDADHVALQATGEAARAWIARRAVGDTVAWHASLVPVDADGPAAAEAVGAFPLLVDEGEGVLARQTGVIESFGERRHPRTAVGWDTASGRLLWVVVDGRQPPYSDGMTLAELERLFLDLGATDAINLDGGGSTTLVVGGRVANRPSDEEGERPVANALALEGCR